MKQSAFALLIFAGAVLATGTAPASASVEPAVPCIGPACAPAPSASFDRTPGQRLAEDQSDQLERFKRQRVRRCCQRYQRGQPLTGYMCSPQIIERAIRRGTCRP